MEFWPRRCCRLNINYCVTCNELLRLLSNNRVKRQKFCVCETVRGDISKDAELKEKEQAGRGDDARLSDETGCGQEIKSEN